MQKDEEGSARFLCRLDSLSSLSTPVINSHNLSHQDFQGFLLQAAIQTALPKCLGEKLYLSTKPIMTKITRKRSGGLISRAKLKLTRRIFCGRDAGGRASSRCSFRAASSTSTLRLWLQLFSAASSASLRFCRPQRCSCTSCRYQSCILNMYFNLWMRGLEPPTDCACMQYML